jgi:hypothetical protein
MNARNIGRLAAVALLFGAAVGTTACDYEDLLEVEDRDRVNPATLEDPQVIGVVISGALGDFQGAYSGQGGEAYLSVSALLSDEFYSSGSFTTRTATDQRQQFAPAQGNTSDGAYNSLQFARRSLRDAAVAVSDHEDYGPTSAIYSELKALEGFALVALGEGFCSAVPLSYVDEGGNFVYGEPLTSRAVLDTAIAKFDVALGANSGFHLASVGKGRALLDQGNYSAAAAAVANVPMDFVYHVTHSVSGGQNPIFGLQGNGRYSLGNGQGEAFDFTGMGAEYENQPAGPVLITAGDGRSPWYGPVPGFSATIDQYITLLYNSPGDGMPLASGVEAWLIRAEAALQGGDIPGMTTLLNELRQNTVDLMDGLHSWTVDPSSVPADLAVPGSYDEAVDVLFQERAMWLVLTGHRLGDLRRQIYLAEYPATTDDDVYPTGDYFKGGFYGDDVVLPLDFDETNNEFFTLQDCDVESASID